MDDRTLLEKAAKAAGFEFNEKRAPSGAPHLYLGPRHGWWNPLTDDGDALRLAVELNLFFKPEFSHFLSLERSADQDFDDCTAHRRAIVRAAAAGLPSNATEGTALQAPEDSALVPLTDAPQDAARFPGPWNIEGSAGIGQPSFIVYRLSSWNTGWRVYLTADGHVSSKANRFKSREAAQRAIDKAGITPTTKKQQ